MVSSLRKRLNKTPPTESGSECYMVESPDGIDSPLTHQPKAQRPDEAGTPLLVAPPPSKSPKRGQLLSTFSPPRSPLERYNLRGGKASEEITPLVEPSISRQSRQAWKKTAFEEDFAEGIPQQTVKLIDPSPEGSPFADPPETRTYHGVEFEMMNKKKVIVGRQGPTTARAGDSSPRRTRSKSKGHQRVDSLDAPVIVKDFAMQPTRTVSYSSDSGGRRESGGHEAGDANTTSVTSAKSVASKFLSFGRTSPASSDHSTIPPLANSLFPKPLNPRRSNSSIPTTPVIPPKPGYNTMPTFLWTSVLPSTSRPMDPWSVTKRWVCCECRMREPEREAAETIVEQRICSRLECGHVRCYAGCEMAEARGYVGI